MKQTALLREQVPTGTNGYELPQADESNSNTTTCPFECPHKHFIPSDGKGVIDYTEKYTGWEYCTLYETKLCRITGGTSITYQIKNCPKMSNEEISLRNEIQVVQQNIQHTEDRLIELKKQLKELVEHPIL